jgi:NADH-ubiquinone oxidoreductase chain 2
MQYTVSNLNAFIILLSIGYSLYYYTNNNKEYQELPDKNNSPIQLITQIKGFFYINPTLALSLTITIFSFVGIPPLIGFFAKQMVLSAALDSGYIFLALVAILTSVISAVYYLNIIKEIFFDKPEYNIHSSFINVDLDGKITLNSNKAIATEKIKFEIDNVVLSNSLTFIISIFTLIMILFIFMPQE